MNTGWLIFSVTSSPPTSPEPAVFEPWRLGLLVGVFLILFAIWGWVNRGRVNFDRLLKSRDQTIKIGEQRWLNSHFSVLLVEVGRERFLLAQNQHGLAWQKLEEPLAGSPVDPKTSPS